MIAHVKMYAYVVRHKRTRKIVAFCDSSQEGYEYLEKAYGSAADQYEAVVNTGDVYSFPIA